MSASERDILRGGPGWEQRIVNYSSLSSEAKKRVQEAGFEPAADGKAYKAYPTAWTYKGAKYGSGQEAMRAAQLDVASNIAQKMPLKPETIPTSYYGTSSSKYGRVSPTGQQLIDTASIDHANKTPSQIVQEWREEGSGDYLRLNEMMQANVAANDYIYESDRELSQPDWVNSVRLTKIHLTLT